MRAFISAGVKNVIGFSETVYSPYIDYWCVRFLEYYGAHYGEENLIMRAKVYADSTDSPIKEAAKSFVYLSR